MDNTCKDDNIKYVVVMHILRQSVPVLPKVHLRMQVVRYNVWVSGRTIPVNLFSMMLYEVQIIAYTESFQPTRNESIEAAELLEQ